MFSRSVLTEITPVAAGLGEDPAAMLAVAEVQICGKAFVDVGARQEPVIRVEGHYFDRRLSQKNREIARKAGLASPVAGRIANPVSQAARWRLLERAVAIDSRAAYESVSWGLGQVMGAHWAWLGYASIDALVAEARSGIGGQARLMARYIEKAGLSTALRRRDWAAFARGYNGPDYARNGYDKKIAAAYERYRAAAIKNAAPKAGSATPATPPKPAASTGRRLVPAWFASFLGRA